MAEETTVQVTTSPAVEVSGEMDTFIKWVEGMSVVELSKLVKALEQRLGVSAAAPVAAAPGGGGAAGGGAAPAAVEKDTFDVVLLAGGEKKIQVIKEVRAVTSLGLKEAKALVEEAPKPVKEGIGKKEAEEIKQKLEAQGATVEIK